MSVLSPEATPDKALRIFATLVRDQEVEGSNPFAPTTSLAGRQGGTAALPQPIQQTPDAGFDAPPSANPAKYSCPNHFARLVPFLYRVRPHVQLYSSLPSATVGREQKISSVLKKRATVALRSQPCIIRRTACRRAPIRTQPRTRPEKPPPRYSAAPLQESQVTNHQAPATSREPQIINHFSSITTHESRNF